MKNNIIRLLCITGLLVSSQAMAQETLLEHVVNACETELTTYCSQVTPGEGRLLHCMAAHEDKVSGQCMYAFYQAATILEQMTTAIAYLGSQCATDIETHCSDVAMGEGRVLACLADNEAEVSDACTQAISDTVAE